MSRSSRTTEVSIRRKKSGMRFEQLVPESTAKGSSSKTAALLTPQHLHRSHTPRHSTNSAHIHHTPAPTPLAYTTPQHLHRSHTPHPSTYTAHSTNATHIHHTIRHHSTYIHRSPTPLHSTDTAHIHHVSPRTSFHSIFSYFLAWGGFGGGRQAMHLSAGIVRVEALSLRRRAYFQPCRRILCGGRACRNARYLSLWSAGIVRVEALSLWRRANFEARRRTHCGD